MVTCCVPSCCTNSRKCDPAISFHEFPTEPDMVAKWIRNINTVVKNGGTWYPRDEDKPYICSKHFLPTDFRTDADVPTLKPRSVPTLFANILGFSSSCMNPPKRKIFTHSPLIVKVKKNSQTSDVSCESNLSPQTEQSPGSENLNSSIEKRSEPIQTVPSFKTSTMCLGQSILKKASDVADNRNLIALNKKKSDLELIEIGPNTFLKINPKVIKIAKKVTPSGNSVLQFIMNKSSPVKNAPEIITIDDSEQSDVRGPELGNIKKLASESVQRTEGSSVKNVASGKSLDNVIGHLVDTHFGKELSMIHKDNPVDAEPTEIVIGSDTDEKSSNSDVAESDFIQQAPVLLTAGVPVSRCLTTGQRLVNKLRQRNRELKALRKKMTRLQNKLETAENKCIVQERELSYAKVKKIKSIRKAAAKGDPAAVYILEQIKAFDGNPVMRWSDSTLRQCSVWCRKAPYAYQYFKKADLFKLPCLSTVKRFMKKCPPEELKAVQRRQGIDEDSSSDFNFDSSDDDDEENAEQEKESVAECNEAAELKDSVDVVLPQPSTATNSNDVTSAEKDSVVNLNDQNDSAITSTTSDIINEDSSSNGLTVQTSETAASDIQASQANSLSVQEVVLPQGIVQCLNSKLGSGHPQYFIIPTLGDQNIMSDHQYSVLQSNSGPLIIQNMQNNQLPLSQDQLIFIAHSAENSSKSN